MQGKEVRNSKVAVKEAPVQEGQPGPTIKKDVPRHRMIGRRIYRIYDMAEVHHHANTLSRCYQLKRESKAYGPGE